MSDNAPATDVPQPTDPSDEVPPLDDVDYLLKFEVAFANRQGRDFQRPVTLSVGGTLVSGYLVSGLLYAEYNDTVSGSATASGMIERYKDAIDQDIDDDVIIETRYAHLKDAIVLHGTGRLSLPFWRGLISRVDGWAFGVFTADNE